MPTIDSLRTMLNNLEAAPNWHADSRVIMDGDGRLELNGGRVRVFQIRTSDSKEQNRLMRQTLLNALNEKFEGLENIPESVRRAMKLGEWASGFGISADGKSVVVGNKPLTMRRIRAVLDAAQGCRSTAEIRVKAAPRQTLAALTGDSFDGPTLSRSLDLLQRGLDGLCRQGRITRATMDQAAEAHLAAAVRGLTNKELLAAFRNLGTEEFRMFGRTLSDDARCNLFVLDALVIREMGDRALRLSEPESHDAPDTLEAHGYGLVTEEDVDRHENEHDLSPRNALALANVEAQGSSRKARVSETFAHETAPRNALEPEDLKKAGDYLRNTPLTMNVNAHYFFSKEGPLSFLGGIWKNLFHAKEEGKVVKGAGYEAKRNSVEAAFYPEFGTCKDLRPKERPTYAAVNVTGDAGGESMVYGAVAVKFKSEVNRRAVYTVNDSFHSLPVEVTRAKADLFLKAIPTLAGLSRETLAKLGNPNGAERHKLVDAIEGLVRAGRTTAKKAKLSIDGIPADDILLIEAAMIDLCQVKGEPRRKNMATFDTIESLLPNLRHADMMNLIKASREGKTMPCHLGNYIEAQIHGDILFPDDVEEITVSEELLRSIDGMSDEEVVFVQGAVEILNGRTISAESALGRALTDEQTARLAELRTSMGGKTLKVRFVTERETTDEAMRKQEGLDEAIAFEGEHFDFDELSRRIDGFASDAAETTRTLGNFVSGLTHSAFGKAPLPPEAFVGKVRERLSYYHGHRGEIARKGTSDSYQFFNRVVREVYEESVSSQMRERLDRFVEAASPGSDGARAVIADVLAGREMTLVEMKRAAGLVEYPQFPEAKQPDLLPQTAVQRRQFLIKMLPVYHAHELHGGFDRGAGVHGRGHICRAFIFAETMASIMSDRGYEIDRAALAMGIVGHDSGRTRNGGDTPEMESRSADLALQTARDNYGADVMGDIYEGEFKRCIVAHESPTLEGVLLNSADSLDIGRTKDFDMKRFEFLLVDRETGKADTPEDDELRRGLQREAALLGILTDPQCAGRKLYEVALEEGDEERIMECKRAIQADIITQQDQDDMIFLKSVEDAIRQYPDQFPLLTRHYLEPLERGAGE